MINSYVKPQSTQDGLAPLKELPTSIGWPLLLEEKMAWKKV